MINKHHIKILFLITLFSDYSFAQENLQKSMYDAAEEMMRFDEKMNQAIIEHNQLDAEDIDEMRLESMMINDFSETKEGYLLERNIENPSETEVKVEVKEGVLLISTKTLDKNFINNELNNTEITTMSSMSVSLFIPNDADENQMQEKYENGKLTITFPKKIQTKH